MEKKCKAMNGKRDEGTRNGIKKEEKDLVALNIPVRNMSGQFQGYHAWRHTLYIHGRQVHRHTCTV